jgi:NAD(P)H-dependent flavin oxidoreductase YrpB (nitropropane dioxygenase family)
MIRTPICDLLNIKHPIALGGMGSASAPAMTAAVSRAGGLGAMGCHYLTPGQIRERTAATRKETNKPFGLNFLLFDTREDSFATALELRPPVIQFAWHGQTRILSNFSITPTRPAVRSLTWPEP